MKGALRRPAGLVGGGIVAVVGMAALAAPWLAPYDPARQDLDNTLASPSATHWLGTDELGRDLLSRILYGARPALVVGVLAVALAVVVGVAVGTAAGYAGGAWDSVLMRATDAFAAFPLVLGALVIVVVAGRGTAPVVLSLALFGWAGFARLARSSARTVRELEFVEASRSLGAGPWRVVARHVLPNSLGPVVAYATVGVAGAIAAQAALSYLGAGLAPGTPDWGSMIATGQGQFGARDHLWVFPCLALAVTALGFALLGDALRRTRVRLDKG